MLIARYKISQTQLLVFQGDLQMSELKQFQVQTARPLPVIVLADTSGSMSVDGKSKVDPIVKTKPALI